MRMALAYGVSVGEFWKLTAWETAQIIRAGRERVTTIAWMTGNYSRAKKLPSLKDEMAKLSPRKPQSPEVEFQKMAGPRPDVIAAWAT